jgi:hypothetical protein
MAPASEGSLTPLLPVEPADEAAATAARSCCDWAMRSRATDGDISNGSWIETSIGVFMSTIVSKGTARGVKEKEKILSLVETFDYGEDAEKLYSYSG